MYFDVTIVSFFYSSIGKQSACDAEDPSSISGLGRSAGEGIGYPLQYSWASLVAQLVKNPPAVWRPGFNPWTGKTPWRRERLPAPVFWPGEFHGLQSLGLQRVGQDGVTFTFFHWRYLKTRVRSPAAKSE